MSASYGGQQRPPENDVSKQVSQPLLPELDSSQKEQQSGAAGWHVSSAPVWKNPTAKLFKSLPEPEAEPSSNASCRVGCSGTPFVS